MSDNASVCPQCKKPLSPDSPAGLCPGCLMAMNMATQTIEEEDAGIPKPPPPRLEDIARFFPNFQLLECLGRGGMGVVYKALQKSLNRVVALKILAPERKQDEAFAKRFVLEAETLAKLSHPNIVTIHDFGQAEDMFYLVMEFVDGVTLRQLLKAGRVAPREALAIVPQICDALQYAHDQGIVHRDIKPENIILDRRGRVKVADFGIAKILGEAGGAGQNSEASSATMTEAGKVVGTPNYMAPEQLNDPGSVDHRADIYALGVVFYQMLTGELPGKRIEPPSKVVHVDVRLDEVVLRALERDPERRYSQASVFKTNVETITATPQADEPGRAVPIPPVATLQKKAPYMSRTAIFGALCLLAPISFATLATVVLALNGNGRFDLMMGRKLLIFGVLPFMPALFLQCILGWIAVAQIQKSEGRIYGMGLALFDGLLLPLLVLNAFIIATGGALRLSVAEGILIAVVIDALLLFWIVRHFRGSGVPGSALKLGFAAVVAVILTLATIFFVLAPALARKSALWTGARGAASGTQLVFTALNERVVRDLIDLDTATLMPLPIPMAESVKVSDPRRYAWLNDDKTAFAWMRARGIDAFQGNHGLVGIDMLAVEISPAEFNSLKPDKVEPRVNSLGLREVPSTWNFNNVAGCYAFRTRQGRYGLLELNPDPPEGVKVRWKMVVDSRPPHSLANRGEHEFSVAHDPKDGTKALDACRSFVREHQWTLLKELGESTANTVGGIREAVIISAADRAGRKVTFRDETDGPRTELKIFTETGIELPAARIGATICESLGWGSPAQTETQSSLQYGDTRVFLLSGTGDENKRFVDLDSGKRFAASEFFGAGEEPSPAETRAWWRKTGIDAFADTSVAVQGLIGLEMVVAPAEERLWNESPRKLDYYLPPLNDRRKTNESLAQPGTPAYMPAKGQLPATFAFMTRDGGRGVLQILQVSTDPAEIKFQYKLAK